MRGIILAIGVFSLCVLAGGVYAQGTGPDLYIPYVDPTRIAIDGLGTDWEDPAVYPQDYRLSFADTPEYFGIVTGSELSGPEDFSAILYLGWSTDNRLYGYCRVTDDVLQVGVSTNGACWGEDTLEIMTDADNSGGDFRGDDLQAKYAQQFGVRQKLGVPMGPGGNEDDTVCHIWAEDGAKWITAPEFFYAVVDYPAGTSAVSYAYEFKLALWDEVGLSVGESRMHDAMPTYEAGVPIGLAIWWDDCDAELNSRDSQIGTVGPEYLTEVWYKADYLNDAYLVDNPLYDVIVAVAPTSWGAVKESLR
ncbi:MAG: hypothetical protein V1800_01675 [Candidatus Latescibacterota bacterium]